MAVNSPAYMCSLLLLPLLPSLTASGPSSWGAAVRCSAPVGSGCARGRVGAAGVGSLRLRGGKTLAKLGDTGGDRGRGRCGMPGGRWSFHSCQDGDGDALTLLLFSNPGAALPSEKQLLLEIDHAYSDGGFAMCLGARGPAGNSSDAAEVAPMPPVLALGNENILQPHAEGLAAGAAGRDMWNGVCPGAGLQTLEAQRLGDWSVDRLDDGRHLSMRNTYFGSQLLFGADGTVVWLSNPVANTALVIAASTGIISQVSLTCVRYPSLAPRTACLPPLRAHAVMTRVTPATAAARFLMLARMQDRARSLNPQPRTLTPNP